MRLQRRLAVSIASWLINTESSHPQRRTYAGAETRTEQIVLAWAPRLPAILSIVGSLSILVFTRKRPFTMYHQLMMGMSVTDIFSSICWFFSTWPVPPIGPDALIWGASGNLTWCKTQGILFILGTGSIWYNVSLAVYYKLVILHGWRERKFTKPIRAALLGGPLLVNGIQVGLSYQHIGATGFGCNFFPIPLEDNGVKFYTVMAIPVTMALLLVVALTSHVCNKFGQQMRRSKKWTFKAQSSKTVQRQSDQTNPNSRTESAIRSSNLASSVLRQSIFYLLAFLAAIPQTVVAGILMSRFIFNFWLSLFVLLTSPLQGFNNALIFFRPRIIEWCSSRRERPKSREVAHKRIVAVEKHVRQNSVNSCVSNGNNNAEALGSLKDLGVGSQTLDSTEEKHADDNFEFLQSHFQSSSSAQDVIPSSSQEHGIHEIDQELQPVARRKRDSILVGSFVLPVLRTGIPSDREPEVSDYWFEENESSVDGAGTEEKIGPPDAS